MVLKKAGSEFIEDIFMKEVKTGKYFVGLQIIEGSVEFKAFGKLHSVERSLFTARSNNYRNSILQDSMSWDLKWRF